jgi:hypothetical protein
MKRPPQNDRNIVPSTGDVLWNPDDYSARLINRKFSAVKIFQQIIRAVDLASSVGFTAEFAVISLKR